MRPLIHRIKLSAAAVLAVAAVGAALPAAASAETTTGWDNAGNWYVCVDAFTETHGSSSQTHYNCFYSDGTSRHIIIGHGLPF